MTTPTTAFYFVWSDKVLVDDSVSLEEYDSIGTLLFGNRAIQDQCAKTPRVSFFGVPLLPKGAGQQASF
jgi:hypothetical protein